MIDFSENDLKQLEKKGISKDKVNKQIETFKEGIPFVTLHKAAVVGDGILRFSKDDHNDLVQNFEKNRKNKTLLKFVPASGAASRMFKALFNFLESYNPSDESLFEYIQRTDDDAVKHFAERMKDFPFHDLIMGRHSDQANTDGDKTYNFVKEMLEENGLNYGFYPKGLLPFHKYGEHTATPFEEHLKEAALYSTTDGIAKLHFTISEQHQNLFAKEEKSVLPKIADRTNTDFQVSYSNQKGATDTLAVDMQNRPFRENDGSILFRPGGHGALIENLNDQEADIIFIKNIDNVVIDKNLEEVANSKKMLAGLLLKVQAKAFEFAAELEANDISAAKLIEIKIFLIDELNVRFSKGFESLDANDQIIILKDKINRPIRICGMVKNEGEPGGGPFWIKDQENNVSLQIVESAQVDMSNEAQVAIFQNSTHFNPVDLVCGVKNYRGEKFDLLNFVDVKQGFITAKTQEGKDLKALELPGLWNGAMALWNTLFVEVPLVTFNPVKTVNDLLKPTHQG